ncbi:MAG: VIT1/CCC1 transporter family protein [Patescibacteria group bacterium]
MNTKPLHPEAHVKISGFLKEAVFGFNDGVVSTFAVIAGLTGGMVGRQTILLAALAVVFPGAFSMGLGTYLGSKSEKELYQREKKREIYEMEHVPELERQEIRDIYSAKGFSGKLLDDVVDKITSDPKVWLDTMMTEELGFAQKPPEPGINGMVMSTAFLAGSLIPTVPYFFPTSSFLLCAVLSVSGLLFAGAYKTRFTGKNIFVSAMETLLIGALAAGGSYGIGMIFA